MIDHEQQLHYMMPGDQITLEDQNTEGLINNDSVGFSVARLNGFDGLIKLMG